MKNAIQILVLLCCINPAYSQPAASHIVQQKNYPLLTLLEQNKTVKQELTNDTLLQAMSQRKQARLKTALSSNDPQAMIAALAFSETQYAIVRSELGKLYDHSSALQDMVKTKLIPSGCYNLYSKLTPKQQLQQAWAADMQGINTVLNVYALGQPTHYPAIDSISFNVKAPGYVDTVRSILQKAIEQNHQSQLFFELPMQAALAFLKANGRMNAADYEPMEKTVNKAAIKKAQITDWPSYPYTVLLVPGEGPEQAGVAIDPIGKMRCRLAAGAYGQKLAPFILVSGGKVHPYKTPFCEAEQMKKYLVDSLAIPANAIIMEPHARHTTTNLRNGARLMIRYGFPLDRPGLIVCEKSDEDYISQMNGRCRKELGYVPYRLGKRITDTELECYPDQAALTIDATEPLDP